MTGQPPVRGAIGEDPDTTFTDGIALSVSAALSAVAGMMTWVIAARLTDRATVGEVSAFVSGFLLVAGLTEFNLGVAILRWVPRAGRRTATVVGRCLLVAAAACVIAAPVYLLVPGSEVILSAAGGGVAAAVLFVVATAGWGVLHLTDFAFVALRRPWLAVVRNVLLGVARIVPMVVLGAGVLAPTLVLAWVGPIAAVAVGFGAAVIVLAVRRSRRGGPAVLPGRREVLTFLGPTWVGTLGLAVLYAQVPLVVTFRFGPQTGGGFFVVWQAITVIDVVATYFVSALAGSVAREPARARELSGAALRRLLLLFLPALVVGGLLATPLLSIFGPEYTDQAGALRVLLAAAAIRLLVLHLLGVRQAVGDAVGFARPHVVVAAATVVALVVVPVGTADVASVLAWTFLGVQTVTALVLSGTQRSRTTAMLHRTGGQPDG